MFDLRVVSIGRDTFDENCLYLALNHRLFDEKMCEFGNGPERSTPKNLR